MEANRSLKDAIEAADIDIQTAEHNLALIEEAAIQIAKRIADDPKDDPNFTSSLLNKALGIKLQSDWWLENRRRSEAKLSVLRQKRDTIFARQRAEKSSRLARQAEETVRVVMAELGRSGGRNRRVHAMS